MFIVWNILMIYTLLSTGAIISIVYYKNNRVRKDKKQLLLVNRWKIYIDSVIVAQSIKSLKMNEKSRKRLRSGEELMAFYVASKEYIHAESKVKNKFRQFIRENKESWVKLGLTYHKSELVKKAYLAFLCEQFCINNPEEYDEMTKVMLDYVIAPSIYCRENALKALYAFGNKEAVVEAFKRLSYNNILHNRKLVTDGLLQFKGNKKELVESLHNHFNQFSLEFQVAFIDFFRFAGQNLKYKLKRLLVQKDVNKELVCALLRYYRKYPVTEYKSIILSWLKPPKADEWECISSAASALCKYPGKYTVNALKSALGSKYWHVRRNSALSLSELNVRKEMITDILNGNDRYASEQLIYQLNYKKDKDTYEDITIVI